MQYTECSVKAGTIRSWFCELCYQCQSVSSSYRRSARQCTHSSTPQYHNTHTHTLRVHIFQKLTRVSVSSFPNISASACPDVNTDNRVSEHLHPLFHTVHFQWPKMSLGFLRKAKAQKETCVFTDTCVHVENHNSEIKFKPRGAADSHCFSHFHWHIYTDKSENID